MLLNRKEIERRSHRQQKAWPNKNFFSVAVSDNLQKTKELAWENENAQMCVAGKILGWIPKALRF